MDSQVPVRRISRYSSDMDILLVGEGDFSFAAALARAFRNAPRLTATSLDSREMLHIKYGELIIEKRMGELALKGAVVLNEVDVTTISQHRSLSYLSFDRIIFNFPHAGFVRGSNERTKSLIRKHRQLMRAFFKNARRMLKVGGEVHVAHHTGKPYSEWRLQEEAAKSGLELRTSRKFKAKSFPGYIPRRGAGDYANGTFALRDPVTFIFSLPCSSPPSRIIPLPLPCTIPAHPPPPAHPIPSCPPPARIVPPPSQKPRPSISTLCPPCVTPPPPATPTITSHPFPPRMNISPPPDRVLINNGVLDDVAEEKSLPPPGPCIPACRTGAPQNMPELFLIPNRHSPANDGDGFLAGPLFLSLCFVDEGARKLIIKGPDHTVSSHPPPPPSPKPRSSCSISCLTSVTPPPPPTHTIASHPHTLSSHPFSPSYMISSPPPPPPRTVCSQSPPPTPQHPSHPSNTITTPYLPCALSPPRATTRPPTITPSSLILSPIKRIFKSLTSLLLQLSKVFLVMIIINCLAQIIISHQSLPLVYHH